MATRAYLKRQQWFYLQEMKRLDEEALANVGEPEDEFAAPPGLIEALQAKEELQAYLQTLQKQPVVTSLDVIEDKWILTVRGIRPPIAHWGEYEIWFVKTGSSNVWSPTKKFGLRR